MPTCFSFNLYLKYAHNFFFVKPSSCNSLLVIIIGKKCLTYNHFELALTVEYPSLGRKIVCFMPYNYQGLEKEEREFPVQKV